MSDGTPSALYSIVEGEAMNHMEHAMATMQRIQAAVENIYVSCPRCPEGTRARQMINHLYYAHEWELDAIATYFNVTDVIEA